MIARNCAAYVHAPGGQRRCEEQVLDGCYYCDVHDISSMNPPGEISLKDQDEIVAATLEDQLTNWWMRVAQEEAAKVVPKAVEYGATDLVEIGRTMVQAMGTVCAGSRADEAELGVYFYLVGKMARWTDAIKSGRKVSDDTLHDIGVYVRMAQRIRETGGWPNA